MGEALFGILEETYMYTNVNREKGGSAEAEEEGPKIGYRNRLSLEYWGGHLGPLSPFRAMSGLCTWYNISCVCSLPVCERFGAWSLSTLTWH